MLSKLAIRNMKRSARDYLVYLLTMTLISALLYTFNSLLFQNELKQYWNTEDMLELMVFLATLFIVFVTAWLISYMVRFMMEKRSREFGIYLLLGMKKRTIARLYLRENILSGAIALLLGMLFGTLFRQVLMAILFSMLKMTYRLHISFHPGTFLMTAFCFGLCYLLSLSRCQKKFRKMNIHDLMETARKNEEIRERHEPAKKLLLPLSVLFILAFWALFGSLQSNGEVALFLIGLAITIYLFYIGLSAHMICYIRKGGNLIYRGQNLFLMRQFSAKIRTMQFTMGTLTVLFTLALMGSSIALMFSTWQNTLLDHKFPFDILLYSPDPEDTFEKEIQFLEKQVTALDIYPYRLYTDGDNQVNTWMLTHLNAWGTMYQMPDGSADMAKIEDFLENRNVYYPYDTYMGISDYNHLRRMLGYEEIDLGDTEYAIQIKPRLEQEVQTIGEDLKLAGVFDTSPSGADLNPAGISDTSLSGAELNPAGIYDAPFGEDPASRASLLSFTGIYADPFSQDGHNGADYLIIVPDEVLSRMRPYQSELAMDIEGTAPPRLRNELDTLRNACAEDTQSDDLYSCFVLPCNGSDILINSGTPNEVKDNHRAALTYMLASLMIPLFYIGLVFLCVAVTVLSVQQLSDAAAYRFRYDVLSKLGLKESELHGLIFKQLAAFYLCPALFAILISGKMMLFAGDSFVIATGVPVSAGSFFLKSIALFFGIYLVYFAVTYVCFQRNIRGRI